MTATTAQDNILKYLIPKSTVHEMVRLGPPEDGGYVVPQFVLDKCSCLFSYGIGSEYRAELEFIERYQKPIYSFDHTVAHWTLPPEINHAPEGLGFGENCNDFIEHCRQRHIGMGVFVKIDVEGQEYEYFLNVDIDCFSDLAIGLCLEVHWLDHPEIQRHFVDMMKILDRNFILVHTHANNWGEKFTYDGYKIYNVYELTFLHKRYVKQVAVVTDSYPLQNLDYPNNPHLPDYQFPFFKDEQLVA
jgi:hypothetical protein|tara:strand:- start:545 stop:1279 length:735 start_codon:yes stop_codon:yes gene_type:complete